MANADNLTRHQFTSKNQPQQRRSRKGIPNRSTKLKKWLRGKVTVPAHLTHLTGSKSQTVTVEDEIALALIARAVRGNVPAIREILDSIYGKITDNHEIAGPDAQPITLIEIHELKAEFEERREKVRRHIEDLDDD